MKSFEMIKDVYWVGAVHPDLRLFDDLFPTASGTTYNSYLVKGDKKMALIDTVKGIFSQDFLANLRQVCDPAKIDYLIVNHTEPDHSGAIADFLKIAPQAVVVISKPGSIFLKELLNRELNILEATDELTLDLGGRTLKFVIAPFLHWPDTMFTYLAEDQVLFPCDAFGSHYYNEKMFNDLVPDLRREMAIYFDCLVRPFKKKVLAALEKVKDVPLKIIAPSHGPIHRSNPLQYVQMYREFAASTKPAGDLKQILVLYLTSHKKTEALTTEIAQGLKTEKTQVKVMHVTEYTEDQLRDALEIADGLLIGTNTINRDVPRPIWNALSLFPTVSHEIKLSAVYGSYGWSGEAVKMVEDRLKSARLKLFSPSLKATFTPTADDLLQAREFGVKFAEELCR